MSRPHASPRLELSIHAAHPSYAPFAKTITRHLPQAAALVPSCQLRSLSIALVGNATMARLHKQYLNIPGPTDVLTYELDHSPNRAVTIGEIIICIPYARKAALKYDVPIAHEVLLYAIHGLLHLSGYDDRTDPDFQRMHHTEDQILSRLKLGPVFSPILSNQRRRK